MLMLQHCWPSTFQRVEIRGRSACKGNDTPLSIVRSGPLKLAGVTLAASIQSQLERVAQDENEAATYYY
jgi:hypothetical protein